MKNQLLLLLFIVYFQAHSQCEEISEQTTSNFSSFEISSINQTEGLRDGDDFDGATLYFPLNSNGNLKSIVLVPGYQATQSSVATWAKFLAKRGFISMTIGTNSLNDLPLERAYALIDAMETIRQENERVSSPLYSRIDINSIAVGGWSMGGGGAQLAAKLDSRIKTIFAITPWLWPNNLSKSDLEHDIPVLIISGELDTIAPNNQHSNVHYNYTPNSTPKLIFEVSGADHNIPLEPSTGLGDLGNIVYAWMQLFLNNNICYCELLQTNSLDQNTTASKYLTNLNCTKLDLAISKKNDSFPISIYPNPASNFIYLDADFMMKSVKIYSLLGALEKSIQGTNTVDISNLNKGVHLLVVESDGKHSAKQLIIE